MIVAINVTSNIPANLTSTVSINSDDEKVRHKTIYCDLFTYFDIVTTYDRY